LTDFINFCNAFPARCRPNREGITTSTYLLTYLQIITKKWSISAACCAVCVEWADLCQTKVQDQKDNGLYTISRCRIRSGQLR